MLYFFCFFIPLSVSSSLQRRYSIDLFYLLSSERTYKNNWPMANFIVSYSVESGVSYRAGLLRKQKYHLESEQIFRRVHSFLFVLFLLISFFVASIGDILEVLLNCCSNKRFEVLKKSPIVSSILCL